MIIAYHNGESFIAEAIEIIIIDNDSGYSLAIPWH